MKREQIARLICDKIIDEIEDIKSLYNKNSEIPFFYVDDLLPEKLALEIRDAFPLESDMVLKKSIREYKYIAAQMNQYNPILEEVIYAFQEPKVVKLIESIVCKEDLLPDENLYAGGISYMGEGNFLNPHLDNSHDKDRQVWRAFNLLYYVSPGWKLEDGGNLELWPQGPKGEPVTIESRFNRLAIMMTNNDSWHSVSQVKNKAGRCCVSNYYFSKTPMLQGDSFHVTSFRGRPEQPFRDLILRADIVLRQGIRKVFKKGLVENPHVYKR